MKVRLLQAVGVLFVGWSLVHAPRQLAEILVVAVPAFFGLLFLMFSGLLTSLVEVVRQSA